MATRNRTQLFIQYRNAAFDRTGRRPGGRRSDFDDGIEMAGGSSPPFWIRLCREAEEDMKAIEQKMPELEKLHKRPVGFGDEREAEHEIEIMTDEITELFKQCQDNIRKIGHPPKGTVESPDATKSRQNAQISLATSLQELSQKFRHHQSNYLKKLQGTEDRNKEAFASNQYFDQQDEDNYHDKGFNEDQMLILNTAEQLAEEREKEIIQIAQSINDLATIFKEMHVLVIDQGTILDRIDYNIEKVVTYTEEATQELTQANKSQKSYGKKLCILLLIVVVVALVMVLIATKSALTNPQNPPPGNRTLLLVFDDRE